jgi:protein-tyrosine phosphatase
MYDTHCHILPGIDDGPRSLDDSLAMCAQAVDDGTRGIVATPHHSNGLYTNPKDAVVAAVLDLAGEIRRHKIELELFAGTEVHLHRDLKDGVAQGTLCTYGNYGKALLIEAPAQILPDHIRDEIFALKLAGITPVLAHAERNQGVQNDPQLALDLVEMGCLVQVTAMSVLGDFGPQPEKTSHLLIRARAAHIVASDAHSPRSRPPRLSAALQVVDSLLRDDPGFQRLFRDIPRALAMGESLPEIPLPHKLPQKKKRFWKLWGK